MEGNVNCASATGRERRVRRNAWVFNAWIFAFVASFVVGKWLFHSADWSLEGPLAVAFSLLPVVPGAFAFRSFLKLTHEADEMLRAVLVEGLVFGFGVAVVFWGAIQLPEHVWLPKIKADWVMAVLLASCSIGIVRAQLRRR